MNTCPDCVALCKLLAQERAMRIWVEGGSFSKINRELQPLGYRLAKGSPGHDPRIEPIPSETQTARPAPPVVEKVAGRSEGSGY